MGKPHTKVLQNSLLLADPSLRDGVFDRSVIHLCEHSAEKGAVGYILNKPTDRKVGEVLQGEIFTSLKSIPIFFGGPVDTDQLVFSVYWWDRENNSFRYRVRISAEEATQIKRRPGSLLIAHIGHSSWHEGQLERELSEQSWVSTVATERSLAVNPEDLWKTLLEELTPFHRLLSMSPEDPSQN